VGGLAAKLAGVSAIAWNIRNSDLSSAHSRRTTRAVVRANALLSGTLPGKILCCSDTARRIHVELGYREDRFHLIPNGFDLQQFRPSDQARAAVRRELGLNEDQPLIGLVARWHPQKDHPGFIRAAAALARVQPAVHFILAGAECDDANPELVRLVAEAGLAGRIHLLGPRSDIPRITAALDIATISSIFGEAFPNILGEAMACAVPCVTTDVGDAAYIVGDTGRVVPPGDHEKLAAAWAEILAMPSPESRPFGR
jgi:glycosyltransferase involved in cell wall biosynthesis